MTPTVSVHDLRVGMFVHLDMGWMKHPFALSSFRIRSADQIEVIRGLGLARVRWEPDASLPSEDVPVAAPETDPDALLHLVSAPEADAHALRLASQRRQTTLLERECCEAGRALRDATLRALGEPQAAHADTQALSRKLLDRLDSHGESSIRLVNSQVGDRASAHGLNVTVMALLLGRRLGLADEEMMALGMGAMLHDVGKLEMPDRLRHHDESFSSAQTKAYREHVAHGVAIGRRMGLCTAALAVIGQHHEAADGSGFPLRLRAEQITLAARIVAIADRYDNLCNPASRVRALTPHEAVSTLFSLYRPRHDAALVGSFIRMMGVYPAGSLVQLTDGRWAMVMAVNAARPLKPRVLVYDPEVPPNEALQLDLEQAPGLGIRRSLPPDRLPAEARAYLGPAPAVNYFFESAARAEDAC